MNQPIRLSLFEVLGLMPRTMDAGQSDIGYDLRQSVDDDANYYPESPIDPDWAPVGYGRSDE